MEFHETCTVELKVIVPFHGKSKKEQELIYNAQHFVLVEVYLNLHSTFLHLHGVYDDLQYATTSNSKCRIVGL
jgi:hypothetical protein